MGAAARDRPHARVPLGRSRESLYRALAEKGNPQLATLMGVLKALGLQRAVKPAADASA